MTTRTEAAAAGALTYTTGRACNRGHTGPRYVSSGTCCQCSADNQARFSVARRGAARALTVTVHPDDVPAVRELVDALTLARSLTP